MLAAGLAPVDGFDDGRAMTNYRTDATAADAALATMQITESDADGVAAVIVDEMGDRFVVVFDIVAGGSDSPEAVFTIFRNGEAVGRYDSIIVALSAIVSEDYR